jgi:signal peptidase I
MRRSLWLGVLVCGGLVAATGVCRAVVVEPLRVASDSMEPTLRRGDEVLVRKFGLGDLRRGDLVTFAGPPDGELALKRIIGLPGDVVAVRDGVLSVNDVVVPEPYVDPRSVDAVYYGPVHVPPGRVLLMGDNRENSIDSRTYGPVSTDALRGTVLTTLW